ncbi:MAG TPA: hypothetical protein VH352_07585 [Pseudonocardiaceae bacterium]|jgi:hypothetical protein|nr:hypothetical protein [Pseudonocardiaceae bacterium]
MCSQTTTAPETTGSLRTLLASYARGATPLSIAIVGNAPLAPDPARAAAIDGADLVIRMTTFALDAHGEPPTHGRRCDVVALHRGVVASPYTFADYTSRLYLLVEPGRLHWEPELLPRWWPADLGFVPIPNREYTLPLLDLLELDRDEPVWPTTGTLITYVMTELFPAATVRLAGMSIVDEPDQRTFRHAWGEPVEVTVEHRLAAEAELLRRWHSSGRIELLP